MLNVMERYWYLKFDELKHTFNFKFQDEPDTSNNKLLAFGQLNSNVKLSCQGDGNPPSEIKWSRNGEDIYQNVHINKQISTLEVKKENSM